jgi:type IV pilus assembly protein PilE
LGFGADPYFVDDQGDEVVAANGIYRISLLLPTTTTFTLQATPVNGQASDGCGTLTLTSTGTKGVSGGTLSAADCW